MEYGASLDTSLPDVPILRLDNTTKQRIVLILSLACQSPARGIETFFEEICGISVSEGWIRDVLHEANKRAEVFDEQVDLSKIDQIAIDEIFQKNKPILTGVDTESTYAFLLKQEMSRSCEAWGKHMEHLKNKGLNPTTSISDEGTGLKAALKEVFPDTNMQADTFHALHKVGKEIGKLERKATGLIKGEYELEERMKGKRPRSKTAQSLNEIRPKVQEAVDTYDKAYILFCFLKILLGFAGYDFETTMTLCHWVLNELEELSVKIPNLQNEVSKVRKILPRLLSFIGRLEQGMEEIASQTGLPVEAFLLMYQQLSVSVNSPQFIEIQCRLQSLLGARFFEAKEVFQQLLKRTKKASSMVENLNGRIRVFIEVKRVIPSSFFALMKVYFNTQRYRRSRCAERIGKSPLELLTGQPQQGFLDALGYSNTAC